jgi:hypothetical protein
MYNVNYQTRAQDIPPYRQTRMPGAATRTALKLNRVLVSKTLLNPLDGLEDRQWEGGGQIMKEPITMIKDMGGGMML